MFRRVGAALFVALWLALLGIEFSEDTGFIDYDEPGLDQSVEAALASLGEAIKVSGDTQITIPYLLPNQPAIIYTSVIRNLAFNWLRKEARFIREDIPIYKFHRVFLI